MDDASLAALRDWTPPKGSSSQLILCGETPPSLELSKSGPGSFAARATYQLPDGGRFSLLLSGNKAEDSVMPLVENELGLPDGFVLEINTYLLTALCDGDAKFTPAEVVNKAMKRANELYEKQLFGARHEPSAEVRTAKDAKVESAKKRSAETMQYEPPKFGSSRLASATLMKQLTLLKEMDTRKEGFVAEPVEDDLYKWNVHLYFDDVEGSTIASDLARIVKRDTVELEFTFPSEYPNVPPVVRVVAPFVTAGHVLKRGGVCMELLTTSGWAPVNSIDVVCIQIRAMLIQGRARIEPALQSRLPNYTFEGALKDLQFMVTAHSWNNAAPAKSRRKLRY